MAFQEVVRIFSKLIYNNTYYLKIFLLNNVAYSDIVYNVKLNNLKNMILHW